MAQSKIFDFDDSMKVRSPKERVFMGEVHNAIVTHVTTTTTSTTTTTTTTA